MDPKCSMSSRDAALFEVSIERHGPCSVVFSVSVRCNPGPAFLQMIEDWLRGGKRERVADERAGEERHARLREGVVAVLPHAAVKRVHELGHCRPGCRSACPPPTTLP